LAAPPKPNPAAPAPTPLRPPWGDVLASIEDGVVVMDNRGCIAEVNPAAELLIGVSAPQAAGNDVGAFFGPTNAWLADLARNVLREGTSRRRGEGALDSAGHSAPVSAACAPVLDRHGGVRGAVLVLHDLTMQRMLEATTRRADRLASLGTVALGLAHEIRNPLGGIKGAAQLLRNGVDDPELVRCTEIIVREVERLDGLVERLRKLSEPPRLQIEPTNIHRILNDVLGLESQAPTWKAITLRTAFDPSLPPVRGDRAQLTQVFLNLVRNAVEAMGGEGEISVSTRMESAFHIRRESGRGRFLSVLIADTGPGIPLDHQANLFSPFFSTKARGSGLGLAICHRIVSEHGGTIGYDGSAGGGAGFRVTLPVCEDHGDDTR
jgi:two-component system nitrogen regulation sensor histidine kinase GlnL